MKKFVLLTLGWICVVIGVIALVVPLIPTTPFLIVAGACFARSSPRFHAALLANRWFGPVVRNWEENRGFTRRQKLTGAIGMWPPVLISFFFVPAVLWLRVLFLVGAGVVCLLVLRLKTVPEAKRKG